MAKKRTELEKTLMKLDLLMEKMASVLQYNEYLNIRDMLTEGEKRGSN